MLQNKVIKKELNSSSENLKVNIENRVSYMGGAKCQYF
ncbi:hypothetical protein KIS4809_0483 [Bacillus sp. ZZV12-4809]|nr:hypothetical protein KIS4809_0483 [Bacillus sp. ZZV12-4809]